MEQRTTECVRCGETAESEKSYTPRGVLLCLKCYMVYLSWRGRLARMGGKVPTEDDVKKWAAS